MRLTIITPTGIVRPAKPYRIDDGSEALRPGVFTVEIAFGHDADAIVHDGWVTFSAMDFAMERIHVGRALQVLA